MKISLVTKKNKPISVGVGKNCFPIENNKIVHSESQRMGARFRNKEDQYNKAYKLAVWAWEIQMFDEIEKH